MPPYGPDDFKSLIPAANASWCQKLLAVPGRLAVYAYRMVSWAINSDLTATDDLKGWLGMSTSTELTAPTGVTASDGTSSTSVVVSWTAVAGASYYTVYRSTGSVFSAATVMGTSTTTSYTDATVTVDTVYTYWVKTNSASAASDESLPDTGFAQSSGANTVTISGSGSWTVPTGVTSITAIVYGKGGNGGARGYRTWDLPGTYYPGGGGGGGEYCTGVIPVTSGESLSVTVDASASAIVRGATTLISCYAGSNGEPGSTSGAGGAGGGSSVPGTTGGTVTSVTRNAGSNGTSGVGSTGGTGGATTPVLAGVGTGGNGSDTASDTNTSGLTGRIVLSW